MSAIPYRALPTDKRGQTMAEFNVQSSVLQTVMGAPAASSVITFTDNTTVVEVAALGSAGAFAAIRWIGSTNTNPSVLAGAGAANFDHIIPPNMVRRFAIPNDPTLQGLQSVVGLNKQAGLFNRMAVISVASVMTSEF